jgi:hypothetical protein
MKIVPALRLHIVHEAGRLVVRAVSPDGTIQPDSHAIQLFEGDRLTLPVVLGVTEIAFGPPPEPKLRTVASHGTCARCLKWLDLSQSHECAPDVDAPHVVG